MTSFSFMFKCKLYRETASTQKITQKFENNYLNLCTLRDG